MIAFNVLRAVLAMFLLIPALAIAADGPPFPQPKLTCDPKIQSCAPATAPAKCEPMSCLASLEAQAKFEKENNCKFPPCSDTITEVPVEVLRQVFTSPSINLERLTAIAEELTVALKNKAINGLIDTKRKLAHFLAQVKQEVGVSMRLTENLDYKPADLKTNFSYFAKHPKEADLYGRTKDHPADQEAIADRAYANRNGNGNVASGDGWRYRGRGMIQLTGKSNYKSFTTEHNKIWTDDVKDFVKNPDLVVQEIYAVRSALLFWKTHNLANIANKGISYEESSKITSVINKDTPNRQLQNAVQKSRRNHETRLFQGVQREMKILKFVLIGFCIAISACSKTETESTTTAPPELEAVFLENDEIPSIELVMDADSSITLKLQNRKRMVVTHELGASPGYDPDLKESFYSMICGKKTLVLVISQEVKSAVSAGSFYDNVLINPADGKVITTFEAGEVVDRETGEIISNNQKTVIAKLKAGVDRNCPAILQPDDDGTARKLLIGH